MFFFYIYENQFILLSLYLKSYYPPLHRILEEQLLLLSPLSGRLQRFCTSYLEWEKGVLTVIRATSWAIKENKRIETPLDQNLWTCRTRRTLTILQCSRDARALVRPWHDTEFPCSAFTKPGPVSSQLKDWIRVLMVPIHVKRYTKQKKHRLDWISFCLTWSLPYGCRDHKQKHRQYVRLLYVLASGAKLKFSEH